MNINKNLAVITVCTALSCFSNISYAAPLPGDTTLTIDAGGAPDASGQCTVGSCFGMEIAPDFWIWTMLEPGNDGGFVLGKNQLSGGQELAPSGTNTTPGDITRAWSFFGAFGTFYANNVLNIFSDTSNDGSTSLNDFNVAWNGTSIDMGGGNVNNYVITPDGAGLAPYTLDYSTVVPSGSFVGVNFRLLARGYAGGPCLYFGGPIIVTCQPGYPIVSDAAIAAYTGVETIWLPEFWDDDGDTHSCYISINGANGNAAVSSNCSDGTYTPGAGFIGEDSFTYTVVDQSGLEGSGTVTVTVVDLPCPPGGSNACGPCINDYPVSEITTVGGGQSPTVNASLQTTFVGQITTSTGLITGGRNAVKICPGSAVKFTVTSSVGNATCFINSAATATAGTLVSGDKLICTNKPDGNDTDRFTIKQDF